VLRSAACFAAERAEIKSDDVLAIVDRRMAWLDQE
jgi:hypothetical protein